MASGVAARVWRMSQPCFRAVETMDRRQAKSLAPSRVRKAPEIFIFTFIMRGACSAGLLVNGTSTRTRRTSSFQLVQPAQQVLSRPSPGSCPLRPEDGEAAWVEREPFAQDVPEASVEALEKGWVERAFAPLWRPRPPGWRRAKACVRDAANLAIHNDGIAAAHTFCRSVAADPRAGCFLPGLG